jgi:uncharacterized protein YdaU (DUF1376 family)
VTKLRTIPWDPKQWLGDDDVLAMDWPARAMHFHLLMLSVQQEPAGSIPNDTALLRRWLHSPSDEVWRQVWPQISSAWRLQDGRWFNKGMVSAHEKQSRYLARYEGEPKNSRKSAETLSSGLGVPDWVPVESWKAFVENRKLLKKPMTPRAVKIILGKLEKLCAAGDDPGAVLDASVEHSWQGVWPLNGRGETAPKECTKPGHAGKTVTGRCWQCAYPQGATA